MSPIFLLVLLVALFCWALCARWLSTSPLTGPMVMVALGLVMSKFGLMLGEEAHALTHTLAEVTLVIVLFSDAARIDLQHLLSRFRIPRKMLFPGIAGVIVLGTMAGLVLFPELGFWGAALLAAILAPTDAALGDAVVSNKAVPENVRESLAVESGLNDGLVLPVVLLFACFTGFIHAIDDARGWLIFGFSQIVFGSLAGIATGYFGARLVRWSVDREYLGESWQGIAGLALAGMAWAMAELVHGNGFLAAFIGGLVFGHKLGPGVKFLFEFAEAEGQLLVLATFALFGAVLLPAALEHVNPTTLLYAVLSLTLVRIVPVVLSLWKVRISFSAKLFLGWFGPRGLASILFALMVAEGMGVSQIEQILNIVFITVGLSVLLHGLTAGPLSTLYASRTKTLEQPSET